MNIKNRQQILALLAIVGVALLVGDKFVLSPLISSWRARGLRVLELKKEVDDGSQLLMRDQVIRDRWEHMRTNTLSINASIAENEVLSAFERWSQDSRLSITSI